MWRNRYNPKCMEFVAVFLQYFNIIYRVYYQTSLCLLQLASLVVFVFRFWMISCSYAKDLFIYIDESPTNWRKILWEQPNTVSKEILVLILYMSYLRWEKVLMFASLWNWRKMFGQISSTKKFLDYYYPCVFYKENILYMVPHTLKRNGLRTAKQSQRSSSYIIRVSKQIVCDSISQELNSIIEIHEYMVLIVTF